MQIAPPPASPQPEALALEIAPLGPEYAEQAARWAARLGLHLRDAPRQDAGAAWLPKQCAGQLQIGSAGLQLRLPLPGAATKAEGKNAPEGIVRVDFLAGAIAHRRRFGGGSGQMIAKAVGLQPGVRPSVLDATAGLGRDAFILAQLGCPLWLIERQPIIAALLEDGLQRAAQDADTAPIIARMRLRTGNAIALMRHWKRGDGGYGEIGGMRGVGEAGETNESVPSPQVIYLDPMFPHRQKSALVKKEMRLLRPLAGDDADAPELLAAALDLATHRVVVKRPRQSPPIPGPAPGYALNGQSSRFDIYPKKSLKSA